MAWVRALVLTCDLGQVNSCNSFTTGTSEAKLEAAPPGVSSFRPRVSETACPLPHQGAGHTWPSRSPHCLLSALSLFFSFSTTLASLWLPRECTRPRPASPDKFPSSATAAAVTCASPPEEPKGRRGGRGRPTGSRPYTQDASSLAKVWRYRFGLVGRRGLGERKGGPALERPGLPGGRTAGTRSGGWGRELTTAQ